ncbi:MAG: RIP metalloprotease RseP [Gammaproteobacteria bacterium]|nr:RIP metalloprotease RseP [Gammaproteobacteria bacterium]
MPEIISTLIAFILAIAILVSIHEYGHYIVARWFDIKILKFSIGFGRALFKKIGKKDQTEYVIASIPLGGFVKMLDENEGEVSKHELHRAFNRQSVYKRFAVVSAGPLVNLIFAVVAFWLMYIIGVQGIIPKMGLLDKDSIAWQSGLREGDVIAQVADEKTPTWSAMNEALIPFFIDREQVSVTLADQRVVSLKLDQISADKDLKDIHASIGMELYIPKVPAIISEVVKGKPAEMAGMQKGDKIININGIKINSWQELVTYVKPRPNESMTIDLKRQSNNNDEEIIHTQLVTASIKSQGQVIGILGIRHQQDKELLNSFFATNQYEVFPALIKSIEKTWDMSLLTLKMMGRMLIGQASIENISGPITIAEVAGHSYRQGVEYFLRFLAIVSLSLGIINLLPIPMLDGGHLSFYLYEMIVGRQLPQSQQELFFKFGIIILVMLMSIAFFNDINRLLS